MTIKYHEELIQGRIEDIPAEQYHADKTGDVPSLSCSIAKILLNQSPAHAWIAHPRLNPDYQDRESASRMDIGTAAHAMLLEGVDSVVICPFDDWRKKDAQSMRDEAREAGKIPLLESQYFDVRAMTEIASSAANKAGFNLSSGKPEQTVIWDEGKTRIRTRPDWLSDGASQIIDYKSTALISPSAWMRASVGNGYDVQDALYRRGIEAVTGKRPDFVFMVQETTAPYCVYFVKLSAALQEIGRIKVERALAIWSACMKSGNWPGYPTEIMEAEATQWQLADAENMAAESDSTLKLFDKDAVGSKENFLFGKVPEKLN